MKIAYVNANYQQNHTGGGHVHIEQFIANAIALGHEIWAFPGNKHPGVHTIPIERFNRIRTLRRMDVLYIRIDITLPAEGKWGLAPRRWIYGFPVVAWEFNTSPEYGEIRSSGTLHTEQIINKFRQYRRGCDLAICVSDALADYVKQHIGIQRVITIPNGSDPELFRPDTEIVQRMRPFEKNFNLVWVGSGKEPWHDIGLLRNTAQIIWDNKKDTDILFHIIGSDLSGLMAEMPPNVFYWGAERYQNLPGWLAGMDVGLILYQPGPAEFNSPLKLFDYLASGLAVLSTPSRFMYELSSRLNQPSLVVPYSDANQLAERILDLKNNRDEIKRLGLAGRQLVIDKYNWHRAVKDTMDEMEIILKEKTR